MTAETEAMEVDTEETPKKKKKKKKSAQVEEEPTEEAAVEEVFSAFSCGFFFSRTVLS